MNPSAQTMQSIATEASTYIKALAHPVRVLICCRLRDSELRVGDIATELGIAQPRLSRELSRLRSEGFVETRRQSKAVFYRLADNDRARALVAVVCTIVCGKQPPREVPIETKEPVSRCHGASARRNFSSRTPTRSRS